MGIDARKTLLEFVPYLRDGCPHHTEHPVCRECREELADVILDVYRLMLAKAEADQNYERVKAERMRLQAEMRTIGERS
jgi:DNA-binding cell septation regulator SpoVG